MAVPLLRSGHKPAARRLTFAPLDQRPAVPPLIETQPVHAIDADIEQGKIRTAKRHLLVTRFAAFNIGWQTRCPSITRSTRGILYKVASTSE